MSDFKGEIHYAKERLRSYSQIVHTEKWQGIDISKKPEMATHEVKHHFIKTDMPTEFLRYYQDAIEPNLPWADNHFEERVCGQPINPGVEWANWPWGHSAKSFLDDSGKFNHNYMERYWPKSAGAVDFAIHTSADHVQNLDDMNFTGGEETRGIYHPYGDLADVVRQLVKEPMTRQAILPVWFPEDTGVVHGGRVPCSLLYQFFMRDNKLDVSYMIRSCDFLRHFRDDIYLTVRLLLWVLQECRKLDERWNDVKPGEYVMLITSLHLFRNDYLKLFS